MKIQFKNIALVVLLTASATGCTDWLSEDGAPKLTYDFYETEEGVDAAVAAAYSYLRWGCGGERFDVLTEMGTDLFRAGSDGKNKTSFNAYGTQLAPDHSILDDFWTNHYKGISDANVAIEQIALAESISEATKNKSTAEAKFLRAFMYFELVQQFGRIPLVTASSKDVRTEFHRASVADVYKQIIEDLTFAVQYLPEKVDASQNGRATRYAAAHLLAKVYLTRGSAVTDVRGQQPTDMDSALYYAQKVIDSNRYELEKNYADLWDIENQGNKEVIFAIQFTSANAIFNGEGNTFHLYWLTEYDKVAGLERSIAYGRPYKRFRPTAKTLRDLFDRKNDSRFYKSFQWAYICNTDASIPKWQELSEEGAVYFTPDPLKGQIDGQPKFAIGDTALYFSVKKTGFKAGTLDMKKVQAQKSYTYYPYEAFDSKNYPTLVKHLDPGRPTVAEKAGGREWVRMRLGETYLIAAEAAGRLGDFSAAADYLNVVRKRAAWDDGEKKYQEYWTVEGGTPNSTLSTYSDMEVTAADLQSGDFVEFMLDERGRELLGETCRWEDLVRTEKFYEWVQKYNSDAKSIQSYHKLRPIPQTHIDRLSPAGSIEEEQNEGYY